MVKGYAPILVLGTKADFSLYTCEILKAEGFNEFEICLLTEREMPLIELQKYNIVILGASSVNTELVNCLKKYVEKGGNLIAFRPEQELEEVFGISRVKGTLSNAYIKIDSSLYRGEHYAKEALQFHGTADLYNLNTAEEIAALYLDKVSPCAYPAAAYHRYGEGKAIVFAYNLPLSVMLTRQGNPELAGVEGDGIFGLRAMDMFVGSWLDVSLNNINQADQQMGFLSRCIENLNINKKPLPRFWYFPDMLKSIAILTNDGENSSETDFAPQFEAIETKGASMSLYIKETGLVSKERVEEWIKRGHEISGHPDDTQEADSPTWEGKCRVFGGMTKNIQDSYGLPMLTNVNHWFVWCGKDVNGAKDFTAEAKLEEKFGIKMDLNYAHYDNGAKQGHFLGEPGNFTGSGLPMRFADIQGNVLDIFQVLTNVYDQQYTENKDSEGFYECFKIIADRSLIQEVYSVIAIKSHNDEWHFSKESVMKMLEYAQKKGIPVWTAKRLLEFIQVKDIARFEEIEWTGECLSFKLVCPLGSESLTIMIPYEQDGKFVIRMTSDNEEMLFKIFTVKGMKYAFAILDKLKVCNIKVIYD